MILLIKIIEILFGFDYSKRKRAEKRLEAIDKIIANEKHENLRKLHQRERDELSFLSKTGFRAKYEHIDFLIELHEKIGGNRWFLVGDAYKLLKKQNGNLELKVTDFHRNLASILSITVFSLWGIAGVIGFFVAKWHLADTYAVYFLIVYALAVIGAGLMLVFAPYHAVTSIDKMLKELENKEIEQRI